MEHNIQSGNQYWAPDDRYSFSVFAFAIERSTNKSIPIAFFGIWNSGSGDFTQSIEMHPAINSFGSGSAISKTLRVTIGRSISARAFTYSMFIITWVLTACSIMTTAVAFSRESGKRDAAVTLLPITAILAIPTIRNLYVGSPPFGIRLGAYKDYGAAS